MNGVGKHQSKPQCCASNGAGTGTDGADHADHQTSSAGNAMIGIRHGTEVVDALTEERCFLSEWSNHDDDPALSIARARVSPGVATRVQSGSSAVWERVWKDAEIPGA